MKAGTIWDDEDQRIYLVAPPGAAVADVRALMIDRGRDVWGMRITVESTPSLVYLREPEGDEDEEALFRVEPDDPRGNPVWIAWYDVPLSELLAPALGDNHEATEETR